MLYALFFSILIMNSFSYSAFKMIPPYTQTSSKIMNRFRMLSKFCIFIFCLSLFYSPDISHLSFLPSSRSYLFHSQPHPGSHPNNISHPDLFWSWSHVTLNIVTDPGCIDLPVQASAVTSCLITTL